MSTLMDSVAGKGRNISTNFWIWLLIGSLLVFAGNTLYATTKASRLGGASTAASRLQLNSQRLANQGREAVAGDAQAFDAFKATKGEVDEDIKTLNDRFGDQAGVSPMRLNAQRGSVTVAGGPPLSIEKHVTKLRPPGARTRDSSLQ